MKNQNIIPGCYYKLGDNIVKAYITGKNEIRFDNFGRVGNDFYVDSFYSLTPQGDKILFPADNTPLEVEQIPLCTEFFEEQQYFFRWQNEEMDNLIRDELFSEIIRPTEKYWYMGDNAYDEKNALIDDGTYDFFTIVEIDAKNPLTGRYQRSYIPLFKMMEYTSKRMRPVFSVAQLQQLIQFFFVPYIDNGVDNAYNVAALKPQIDTSLNFTFNYLNK